MRHTVGIPLLVAAALFAGSRGPIALQAPTSDLTDVERAALRSRCDPALDDLRAGSTRDDAPLSTAERDALAQAQQSAPDLGALRGGEVSLSDRELKIIGIVLLAVLVIAVVA